MIGAATGEITKFLKTEEEEEEEEEEEKGGSVYDVHRLKNKQHHNNYNKNK